MIDYRVPPEWYEGVYHDVASPCKAGRSFSMVHGDKPSKAVLLIHGYAGYPGELVRPARELYADGADVFVPRLPGCGTCGKDFEAVRRKDWIKTVENALSYLKSRYASVSVLGHSMGSALAVLAASHIGCDRLVLAAPAVGWPGMKPPKRLSVIYLFSLFKKRIPTPWHHQSEFVMYYENAPADDDYLGGEYWSWVYMRQLYELYTLMQEAGKAVGSIAMPTLAISAGKDQIVGSHSSDYIMSAVRGEKKHLHLPECTHYFFYDPDKKGEEEAVQAVRDFLRS